MEITPKHQRNMYAIFIGLFAVNVIYSIWNIHNEHKLRKIQSKIAEEQLKNIVQNNSNIK